MYHQNHQPGTLQHISAFVITCHNDDTVLQGMLGIGAAMLGSSHVIGIDIDADALQTAQENCDQFEDLQVRTSLSIASCG